MEEHTGSSVPSGAVVVGYDGSSASECALDWAGREAAGEGRPLVVVSAMAPPPSGAWVHLSSSADAYREMFERLESTAGEMADAAARRVADEHGLDDVHHVVLRDDPRHALVEASVEASCLVVGDRGLGPVADLLLGSVSAALVKHSESPVVVVRPTEQHSREAGVLVGVAGDDRDGPVCDFAFDVAAARGLPVTLAHSFWDVVRSPGGSRDVEDDEDGYDDQRKLLDEAGQEAAARHPDVPVRRILSRGFADVQLISASRRAELLVLGHRRKKLMRELVYGSVAPRVVEHAHCTAAVVPLGDEADRP